MPVAATFNFRDENGESRADVSFIDHMITVEYLRNTGQSLWEEDDRAIIDLMVEQIEFASTVVFNKVSEFSKQDLDIIKSSP